MTDDNLSAEEQAAADQAATDAATAAADQAAADQAADDATNDDATDDAQKKADDDAAAAEALKAQEDAKKNERVVPEKATDYKLPKGMPPQVGEFAKANDFTQAQLDAALAQFGGYMEASKKAEVLSVRKLGEAHIEGWGDSKKTNLSLAKAALKQNDPDGALTTMLNESGYGSHPAVLDFLHKIGQSMQEGGFLKSTVNRPPGKKSAAQTMFPNHPSKNN